MFMSIEDFCNKFKKSQNKEIINNVKINSVYLSYPN
jgi:hypothetical protein